MSFGAVVRLVGMEPSTSERPSHTDHRHAGAGDAEERSFDLLIEPYRRELQAHCYRMLGSTDDAEEAVQDAMLRAWRGLSGFAGRSSLRTWLYTIATNVCLTRLERRPRRELPADMGPAADPLATTWTAMDAGWIEPFPDAALDADRTHLGPAARYEIRESVEIAFITALQHLPARQRAALILRDVVGFSAKETAAALTTTVASVTSALQRARAVVKELRTEPGQQAAMSALGDVQLRRLVERYIQAWERGDVTAIVSLLTDDITFSMPPYPVWYAGREDIAAFLPIGPLRERWRLLPVGVNGQLAFACYARDDVDRRFRAHSIDVLTLRDERIAHITAFLDLDAATFRRFGAPAQLG